MSEVESEPMRRLPPGPHGLPPELVERNQRERLIAAIAEVCAEKGYGSTSVADVTRRAGVSTASFYRQFKDKRECMLTGFEELFGRFLGEVERACAGEVGGPLKVRAGAGVAVSLLASDPPTARLLTVEVVAVGPAGVRLQHEAIERLATALRDVGEPRANASDPSPEWVAVAATATLAAKRVAAGKSLDLAELEAVFRAAGVAL